MNTVACDTCSKRFAPSEAYLLITEQVVCSPQYWRQYFGMHKEELASLSISTYEQFCAAQPVLQTGPGMAMSDTPWLVCEDCIGLFQVDKAVVRDYARRCFASEGKFMPPGTGPAPLEAINFGDGKRFRSAKSFFEGSDK